MARSVDPSRNRQRYATLDAMRGIAALLVAVFHLGQSVGYRVPEGYLAVDMFFALSGFVIALNYTQRLQSDMSWRTFMTKRLIRLYPLYFLGALLGMVRRVSQLFRTGVHELTPAGTLIACLLSLVMLPVPPGVGTFSKVALFPINGPSWSLFLEVAVNMLFALILFRLSSWRLAGVAVLAALYLIVRVGAPAWLDVGWVWANFDQGVARTLYAFPVGILLWRLAPTRRGSESWIALAVVTTMACLLCAPIADPHRKAFELVTVLAIFPLLLYAGLCFELPSLMTPVFSFLGDISYAVYAIHGPLLAPFVTLSLTMHLSNWLITGVFVVAMVLIGATAHYLFDIPVRRWASKRRGITALHASPLV